MCVCVLVLVCASILTSAAHRANQIVMAIRKRKGMKTALPTLADFLDPMALRGHA